MPITEWMSVETITLSDGQTSTTTVTDWSTVIDGSTFTAWTTTSTVDGQTYTTSWRTTTESDG